MMNMKDRFLEEVYGGAWLLHNPYRNRNVNKGNMNFHSYSQHYDGLDM